MNDPKEIIVGISTDENALDKEQKEQVELTEENRFNNLLLHFKENLQKRLYKRTTKEINSFLETNNIKKFSYSWKIYILKIRAILSIIKNKIMKYLVKHIEKIRIKHHINMIKKYFFKAQIEFINFYRINNEHISTTNFELINDLLFCYLEFILLMSFFHKKLGNIIDAIAYLSLIIKLYKETLLIPKTNQVHIKFELGFITLINLYICNEDYSSAFYYLNIAIDLCFKNIIYQTKDLSDGVYKFDKNKTNTNDEKGMYNINKIKKIILNIIFIFLYRSICYENIGKIINAIKCDYQSIWFLNHFYTKNFRYFYYLFKNILEKRTELKNELNYIEKMIKNYEKKQRNKIQDLRSSSIEKNNENQTKILYSEKYEGLVNKLEKLKIPEIDFLNKFEIKKNFKRINSQKIQGKDKNNFLYGMRLYNTYLREDFRPIIDSMKKINSYDIDYHTQEKILKFVRKISFEQNEKNIKLKNLKFHKRNLNISLPNFKTLNKMKTIKIKRNIFKNRAMSTKNTQTKILFSSISRNNSLPDSFNNFKSNSTKNKKSELIKNFTQSEPPIPNLDFFHKETKKRKIPKYKVIKLTSIFDGHEVYKDNEKLNKFFNKKYLAKRDYIKKLESREINFQKYLLKTKNTPNIPYTPYNKEMVKRVAEKKYQKILSLSVASTPIWKENLTKEEYHKIKVFNKLENSVINSLNKSALMKFKEEEKKMRQNKYINIDENDNSKNTIDKGNKSLIEKLNINLEEILQRKNIDTQNYIKLCNENKQYIRHRNERNTSNILRKNKEKDISEFTE